MNNNQMIASMASSNLPIEPYSITVAKGIIEREATPEAIQYFEKMAGPLENEHYWFFLSTLWVSYTGHSDLNAWKRLFSSNRDKKKYIMKRDEIKKLYDLPYFITIYRAHREDEEDWIAYTLDPEIAARFARERGVASFKEYKVKKRDVLALFTRRGEQEVIVLNKNKPKFVQELVI